MAKKPKEEVTDQTQAAQVFKPVMRGALRFIHHAFKLKSADMIKNVGYKKFAPTLEKFQHTHIFHTIDSQGRKQAKSMPVGGHYHYIEVTESPDGTVSVKCGPAKHIVEKRLKSGGFRRSEENISFYDERTDGTTVDNHTHEIEHLYSDEIQVDPGRQTATAAIAQSLTPKPVAELKDLDA